MPRDSQKKKNFSDNVKPWPQTKPEPTYRVNLSCGCEVRFPQPLPKKGEVIWCRLHKEEVRAE